MSCEKSANEYRQEEKNIEETKLLNVLVPAIWL